MDDFAVDLDKVLDDFELSEGMCPTSIHLRIRLLPVTRFGGHMDVNC